MRRRDVLLGALLLPAARSRVAVADAAPAAQTAAPADTGEPFDAATVRDFARALAAKDYQAPDTSLPDEYKDIGYDEYRKIRYRPDRALWRDDKLPFRIEFFHRGFIFANRVDIAVVDNGRARPVHYAPDLFSFDGKVKPPQPNADLGFAGFRLHYPLNRPDYFDEVGVFLGASYFRAVARGQGYGLSARGLSVNTANPKGEEFPAFKRFWIEKPGRNARALVVHALLDSPSAAAALRFVIKPGEATVYDTELALFPRTDIGEPGIASLTSMYYFDANDRRGVDDFRAAVHDSGGLAIQNGSGEQIFRPLANPRDLQISTFADHDPRGFGLMQRQRDFRDYEDLEARYEKRPSAWIEPAGNWGDGVVQLIEIPTKSEVHDNIVAFWRPKDKLRAKQEYRFAYRIHWGRDIPKPHPVAPVAQTRIGADGEARRVIVDFADKKLAAQPADALEAAVSVDKGKVDDVVVHPSPQIDGVRLSFRLAAKDGPAELRAALRRGDSRLSEVWIYRWTP